ncbi:hypothetical protein ACFFU9_11710 [Mariniflexile ostreae]|uniref:Uncharacterized protein n=1 Tax=Mariniflexile ostreae TaxID=1520892 RepID=A0ABV5FD75_9FLAO
MKVYKNKNQELDARIAALETKRDNELLALKMEANVALTELRPSKLLKRAFTDVKEAPEAKKDLFEILVSLAGGYLSKKLVVGKSNGIFKNLLGYAVQYLSTKIISKKI